MTVRIIVGDVRERLADLADESAHCCVTSPPYYGLRDYGCDGQIGLEATPDEYVSQLAAVFRDVRRVLRRDGTLWLNIGDSYSGPPVGRFNGGGFKDASARAGTRDLSGVATSGMVDKAKASGCKPKDLIGIPWMLAFALRADGWWLRQDIIWAKPNPMPESVTDRCTKSHEYLFLLSKSERYWYDAAAIAETSVGKWRYDQTRREQRVLASGGALSGGTGNGVSGGNERNKRSVWTVATQPYGDAHFATFPPALIEPCILAGCPKGGTVLDPFVGAGTTALVADRLGRNAVGIELNPAYAEMARRRIEDDAGMFAHVDLRQSSYCARDTSAGSGQPSE